MPEIENALPKVLDSEKLNSTLRKVSKELLVPVKTLIELLREGIDEVLEGSHEIIESSAETVVVANDFHSVGLNITAKNGKKESVEIAYTFDAKYYRGYIRELAKQSEEGQFFNLANIRLVLIKKPKDNRASRLKEMARKDVRMG